MRLTLEYHEVLQDCGPLEAGIAARYAAAPQDFDPVR
jgi:hypothetical protein